MTGSWEGGWQTKLGRNPSIMSAQPAGVLVGGHRAALAVDGADAVHRDIGGAGVGALDLMELRDLLVGGHHGQQLAGSVEACLRREDPRRAGARGAERAGYAAARGPGDPAEPPRPPCSCRPTRRDRQCRRSCRRHRRCRRSSYFHRCLSC